MKQHKNGLGYMHWKWLVRDTKWPFLTNNTLVHTSLSSYWWKTDFLIKCTTWHWFLVHSGLGSKWWFLGLTLAVKFSLCLIAIFFLPWQHFWCNNFVYFKIFYLFFKFETPFESSLLTLSGGTIALELFSCHDISFHFLLICVSILVLATLKLVLVSLEVRALWVLL